MKQTLVLALFSFAVATATTTWFATKIAPPRSAQVVAIDTTRPKPAAQASKPRVAPADTGGAGKADSTRRGDSPRVAAGSRPVRAPYVPDPDETARAKAVAKIMASMKPKDAVEILAKLSDDEVERIIRQLNAKQVAALMPALPQERAAALSRRLLEPRTGPEGGL